MTDRPTLRSRWALAFAACALAATAGWCGVALREASRDQAPTSEAGPAMPEFRLPTADGHDLAAKDLRGRVVLYEFWATWCTPCHVQVEILKELYPQLKAKGVEFVGVATGEPADLVREHLAKHPSPYPVVIDTEETVGTALEILGLPTLIVVDTAGRIVWRHTGLSDAPTLERVLADATSHRE
jgi:peroxiredoxin